MFGVQHSNTTSSRGPDIRKAVAAILVIEAHGEATNPSLAIWRSVMRIPSSSRGIKTWLETSRNSNSSNWVHIFPEVACLPNGQHICSVIHMISLQSLTARGSNDGYVVGSGLLI